MLIQWLALAHSFSVLVLLKLDTAVDEVDVYLVTFFANLKGPNVLRNRRYRRDDFGSTPKLSIDRNVQHAVFDDSPATALVYFEALILQYNQRLI